MYMKSSCAGDLNSAWSLTSNQQIKSREEGTYDATEMMKFHWCKFIGEILKLDRS